MQQRLFDIGWSELHRQNVAQMIESAEGSAGLLHKVNKPTAWRGGAKILKKEEGDARLLERCEAKRTEWAKHWQCDEDVQNVHDKQWKNNLKKSEEALPRIKECGLEKVSKLYNAKQGEGRDGFHAKVALDVTKKTRGAIVEFFFRSGKWLQQACTTIIFCIPKNVTIRDRLRSCRR